MFTEQVQSTRSAQRDRTRERVLDAAQRLFADRGFTATTVRRIASAAGVSVGTVMTVGDKDALLLAVYDRRIAAVHAAQERIPAPAAGRSAADRIGDLIAPFLDMYDDDLPLAREYGAVLARGTHRTEVFGELGVALVGEFTQILREAGFAGRAEAAARAVYFSYLGLLLAAAAQGTEAGAVRTLLEDVVDVLTAGP
ncbi:TetR/AcrR family transcriptional regulator [Gordonia caeni]|uniref:TetR/AcrR family transcriptional regulator n=1 Tax=Gordonia caeni TaxID=1007097 RepID=A0ABP7P779_9ACTN